MVCVVMVYSVIVCVVIVWHVIVCMLCDGVICDVVYL